MAILDTRLLDLVDSLVKARLDWLAFELIEGIQEGRPTQEPENVLAAAREAIRSHEQPMPLGEPATVAAEPRPIEGDDQIEWAAIFVSERLDEALAQLEASIATLDDITAGSEDQPADAPASYLEGSIIVLSADEQTRKSRREDIAQARAVIPALKDGLAVWSAQMRGEAQV